MSQAQVWSEMAESLGWGHILFQPGHAHPPNGAHLPHHRADSSADLSSDSRAGSTAIRRQDGEGYTDGESRPHTDVDRGPPASSRPRSSHPVLAVTSRALGILGDSQVTKGPG